ncbi:MAG: Flp pilus assembly complex ATPase component TadA [Clostridia bacterium]|nr:Flp pilus assembly complex ATPase component TadA [Clostridia bacterium]
MRDDKNFENVLYAVSDRVKAVLCLLSPTVKANTCEIRLREGLPLSLTIGSETVFLTESGKPQFSVSPNLFIVTKADLEESFKRLCNNSVFAHENELQNGYIVMRNGSRAGVCGDFSGKIMQNISSVNIRIAREVLGAANDIVRNYVSGGLLIVGPPGSGKTTVLRDLVRQISNGVTGRLRRVAVIDSRCEISGSSLGKSANDLGANTDILLCKDKAKGIEIALRTMFPDIIAFDEIGNSEELQKVSESFCAGVDIITTAHAGNLQELESRNVTNLLLQSGAISKVALLPKIHGGKIRLFDIRELFCDAAV